MSLAQKYLDYLPYRYPTSNCNAEQPAISRVKEGRRIRKLSGHGHLMPNNEFCLPGILSPHL